DNPLTITLPATYTELGATALDDIDGDITDKIEITGEVDVNPGTYEVTYTVSDAAGNATSSTREVTILAEPDTTAPEITILGDNPLTIILPAEYTELGATAFDDTDGDISDNIEITTTTDFLVPGSYEVTYSVSDVAENSTSVTREVIVEENTLSNGLIGKFDLNGNGDDTSGYNNHGTITNRPEGNGAVEPTTNRDGMSNSAMLFVEEEQGYIHVEDYDALKLVDGNPISDISISVWVKADEIQTEWNDIISKWDGPESDNYGYYLGLTSGEENDLRWNVSNAAVETAIPKGVWVHIVVTYEHQTSSKIYLNGELVKQMNSGDADATNIGRGIGTDYNARFSIGGAVSGEGGGQFDGGIDDVYVYDRVLTESEVQQLYNN
ncbi:MAG: immunoglobulin-like domain-containing protein, partial [Flavobacteriaceae bacterium]